MNQPDSLFLYVEETAKTANFFSAMFAAPVVEQSANFAMIALHGGLMLGLWAIHDVKSAPTASVGGLELGVTLGSDAEVDAALAEVRRSGIPVVQGPVRLDFGYTFLVESPDGHLIRVFSPSQD